MRLVAQVVLLATLVSIGACGASDTPMAPPTDSNVVGTYNLTGVNGGPLPFPYSANSSSRTDIVGGRITLTADHTFTDALTKRVVLLAGNSGPDQIFTNTFDGTWVLTSFNLELTYTGGGVLAAVVGGGLIFINDQGLSLKYSK